MSKPYTYKYDDDDGLITFYCNSKEIVTWSIDDSDDTQSAINDFEKILSLGASQSAARIEELEKALKRLSTSAKIVSTSINSGDYIPEFRYKALESRIAESRKLLRGEICGGGEEC
jgi:hypothetical protein